MINRSLRQRLTMVYSKLNGDKTQEIIAKYGLPKEIQKKKK